MQLLSLVQRFISEDRLPHLLFYGPPGTGKTSTILAVAKQLYPDKEFSSMVLEVKTVKLIKFVKCLSYACTLSMHPQGSTPGESMSNIGRFGQYF
jgi:DNA polymerase III delta prime subunit